MTVLVDTPQASDDQHAGSDAHPRPEAMGMGGAPEANREPETVGPETVGPETVGQTVGPGAAPEPNREPARAAQPRSAGTWVHTVSHQGARVSAKLAPIARQAGDRVAAASPTTLLLGLLGLLAALSIVASVSSSGSLGVTSAVLFVPALSAAIGAIAMRSVAERRDRRLVREAAQREATQLRHLEHTLDYVDAKLTAALTQFNSDRRNDAVIAMFQAKAATELYRGPEAAPQRDSARDSARGSASVAMTGATDSAARRPLPEFDRPGELRSGERLERSGLSLI